MATKCKLIVLLVLCLSAFGFAQSRKPDFAFKLGATNYFMNLSKGNAKAQNDTAFYNLYRNGKAKRIAKEIKHIVNRNTSDTLQAGYYVVSKNTISFFQTFKAKQTTQRVYTQNANGLLSVESGVLIIDPPKLPIPPMAPDADNTGHLEKVDIPAEFPGGINKARQYIANSLVYPLEAQEAGIEATIHAKFVSEKDGTLTNIQIENPQGYGLDEEVIRVLKRMPKWKPALLKEHPVRSQYRMPISFKLH